MLACIDNLSGFADAIEEIYPQTEVQLFIIHQIRNSKKYLAWKDIRAFMADLKRVYQAKDIEQAANWGKKYPAVIRSRHNN